MPANPVAALRSMVEQVPSRLAKITEDAASRRPSAGAWSAKEELGHLLDSAIMNHVRLLRVLAEANPTLPGYNGEYCVEAHDYAQREWRELIATWQTLNAHFVMAAEKISADAWQRPCTFENRQAKLDFLFADYVHHALHHLEHIGISIADFKMEAAAHA